MRILEVGWDSPQDAVAIGRIVDCLNTHGGILLSGVGHIDTDRLGMGLFGLADDDLNNLAVLSEVIWSTQRLEKMVLLHTGTEASDVDEVLLDDTQAGQMFPTQRVGLTFLSLFLSGDCVLLGFCGLSGLPCQFPARMLNEKEA